MDLHYYKNMEILRFVEFEYIIKNIDVYFDNSIFTFWKKNQNDQEDNSYNFAQLIKDKKRYY